MESLSQEFVSLETFYQKILKAEKKLELIVRKGYDIITELQRKEP